MVSRGLLWLLERPLIRRQLLLKWESLDLALDTCLGCICVQKQQLIATELSCHSRKRSLLMNYTQLIQDRNIKVYWKAYCSCFREILKPSAQGVLPIRLIVVVRAMGFFASNSMKTRFDFKEVWMKFLFFPSMAEGTFIFILTSIFIRCDEILSVPVDTHIF